MNEKEISKARKLKLMKERLNRITLKVEEERKRMIAKAKKIWVTSLEKESLEFERDFIDFIDKNRQHRLEDINEELIKRIIKAKKQKFWNEEEKFYRNKESKSHALFECIVDLEKKGICTCGNKTSLYTGREIKFNYWYLGREVVNLELCLNCMVRILKIEPRYWIELKNRWIITLEKHLEDKKEKDDLEEKERMLQKLIREDEYEDTHDYHAMQEREYEELTEEELWNRYGNPDGG